MDIFGNINSKMLGIKFDITPYELYKKLSLSYDYTFLLESMSGPKELVESSIIGFDPSKMIKVYSNKIVLNYKDKKNKIILTDKPFIVIKNLIPKSTKKTYRYFGGAVGIINYDAIGIWEKSLKNKNKNILMEFGIYEDGIIYDKKNKKLNYFYLKNNRFEKLKNLEKHHFNKCKISKLKTNINAKNFNKILTVAKQHIAIGDIFQIVLSRRINFDVEGDALKIYDELRKINPSPYLYYLKMKNKIIIGSSPEMLLRITNNVIETFPIAGTRKISKNKSKNDKLKNELQKNEKEVAEHTMLVDLGRNDLGKICKYGTIKVNDFMKIKQYSHVQHMITHIIGKLKKEYDMFDAFQSVFPAGTVSGAPKIRAIQIIDKLEKNKRGPYAGAVGYFSSNGNCDFAISIRSIFINNNKGFIQTGAGILLDSKFQNEFKELNYKAAAMLTALKLASR
ncbi:MAG: anthranilate synthase component I family protein [Thaumarchaeota archaeon]|nr:anthranilate synthase component I family protein [Nitrososphaerota archaeon]